MRRILAVQIGRGKSLFCLIQQVVFEHCMLDSLLSVMIYWPVQKSVWRMLLKRHMKKAYMFTGSKLQVHILIELQLQIINLSSPPDKGESKQTGKDVQITDHLLQAGRIQVNDESLVYVHKSSEAGILDLYPSADNADLSPERTSSDGFFAVADEIPSAVNPLSQGSLKTLDSKKMADDKQQTLYDDLIDLEHIPPIFEAVKLESNEASAKKTPEGSTSGEGLRANDGGKVVVIVHEAKDLRRPDPINPFVEILVCPMFGSDQRRHTKVVMNNRFPKWEEEFEIPVGKGSRFSVGIFVYSEK